MRSSLRDGRLIAVLAVLGVVACIAFWLTLAQRGPNLTTSGRADLHAPDGTASGSVQEPNTSPSNNNPTNSSHPGTTSVPDANTYVRNRLRLYDFNEDVAKNYDYLKVPRVDGLLLTDQKAILIAAFPAIALNHYNQILSDTELPWTVHVAALDGLGALARGQHQGVKTLYLSLLEKGRHQRVVDWAVALLGHYYHGPDIEAVLSVQATTGSTAALAGLSFYPSATVIDFIKPKNGRHEGILNKTRERVHILREPNARAILAQIIETKHALDHSDDLDATTWAIECAARLGYDELVPRIRASFGRLDKSILGTTPDEWSYWRHQKDQAHLKQAVRALARLGNLRDMEKRFIDFHVLTGSPESAISAIELRRTDPTYVEYAKVLATTQRK